MSTAERQGRIALAAIGLALLSALFFTMTYVLNRASASEGGHWAWLASLRYLITLPLMLPLMRLQGGAAPVLRAIAAHPGAWLRCAAIGFVLFYVLLSYAASSGPAWLVAGSFQFTVIAGMLCAPLLYRDARRRIPPAGLAVAGLILAGVLLVLGLFTPLAGAAALAYLINGLIADIAAQENPRQFQFFLPEGHEYQITLIVVAAAVILAGPGRWGLDAGRGWARRPFVGSFVALLLGIGGGIAVWMLFNGTNPLA